MLTGWTTPRRPPRVAYSPDLGITPVDSEVAQICRSAIERFTDIGAEVEEASPDFTDAEWIFQTLRGAQFVASYDSLLREHRSELKEEVIWNIEHGLALSPQDIARAELGRGAIINRCADFFRDYDVLVCPTVVAPPFDVDTRYLAEMEGHTFPTYISWLILTFALTLTGCPVISVPCGFTKSGLPVGIQIMAPWKEEGYLLGVSALFEQAAAISGPRAAGSADGLSGYKASRTPRTYPSHGITHWGRRELWSELMLKCGHAHINWERQHDDGQQHRDSHAHYESVRVQGQVVFRLMDEVAELGEEIVITKNGKPVAKLAPYR